MRYGVINLNHSLVRILHRVQHDEGLKEVIEKYGLLSLVVEVCWSISVGQPIEHFIGTVKRKVGVYDDSTFTNLDLLVTQFVSDIERELTPYRVVPGIPVHLDLLLFDLAHNVMSVEVKVGWEHGSD